MPSTSIIGAIVEFYQSLPVATPSPPSPPVPILFDEVPAKDGSGNPYKPPYVLLKDNGTTPSFQTFEYEVIETTDFTFEIYALSLAAADAIALGIRFGAGAYNAAQGFDWCTSLPVTGQTIETILPPKQRRMTDTTRTETIGYVFKVTLDYSVQALRTGP
ncbi:hypothetical protein FRUB_10267 [Fimbriiglobus ruber]|uniref:Phage protein n=2 Tax=Fimbriiglobus ruber TaxID=1908690 RepID=A0A225DAH3_9BACT|nr:hypothetical protein FRUB_10267 [Fimbriiglobus ruber]